MPSPVQIYFAVMNTNGDILKKQSEKDEASKKGFEESEGTEGNSGMAYADGCPLTVREGAAWLDTLFEGKKGSFSG